MAQTTAAEYLEKLFAESFKRELDQDENVVRSLPFFTAALALAVTLLGIAGRSLLPFDATPWTFRFFMLIAAILLAGCAVWALCGVLWHLFAAVRPRSYTIPPTETELIAWENQLRTFHTASNLDGDDLERAVVTDLRDLMIKEYAKAAMAYRANNIPKLFARSQALMRLIMLLAFAFASTFIIFLEGRVTPYLARSSGDPNVSSLAAPSGNPGAAAASVQTEAAREPVPDPGRAAAVGGREQVEGQPGAADMTTAPSTPGSSATGSPTAAAGAQKPAPPVSQTFQRGR